MNKKTIRIAGWALGLSMAVAGIGVAAGTLNFAKNKEATMVAASETANVSATFASFGLSGSTGPGAESSTGYDLVISSGTSSNGVGKNETVKNTIEFPGSITNVTVNGAATSSSKTDGTFEVFGGTTEDAINTSMGGATGLSSSAKNCSIDFVGDYTFFKITVGSARTLKFTNIVITYSTAITSYKVTYNGNGNTGGSVPTDSTKYKLDGSGTCTVLGNINSLTKTHYTFNGWNTSADGSGTARVAGDTFSVSSDVTLYAQWVSNEIWLSSSSGNVNANSTLDISSYVNGATGTITYASSDTSKATVSSAGVITGVAAGNATITISDSGTSTSAIFTVTVVSYIETEGIVNGGKYILTANDSHYFDGTVSGGKGQTSTNDYEGAVFTFNIAGNNKYTISDGTNYISIGTSSTSMGITGTKTILRVAKSGEYYEIRRDEDGGRALAWYDSGSDIRTYAAASKIGLLAFDATEFSKEFVSYYTSGCKAAGGYTSADMHWSDASARFAKLSSANKNDFKIAVASESGTDIQKAAARYDYIVGKYGTGTFADFADRSPSGKGGVAGVLVKNNIRDGDKTPLIITVITASAIVSGGLFFLQHKHRKED